MMPHLAILSSSIRTDRQSHRVALYFERYITNSKLATVEILDLKTYDFPLFEERLKNQKDPIAEALAFKNKIVAADGIIIVTPEYNGSFPASLKNAIDLLYEEWKHKPISIATVSAGPYGGTQCLIALQFVLWKIMAFTVPSPFLVANVSENYDAKGNAIHKETTDRYAAAFVSELLSCIKANTQ